MRSSSHLIFASLFLSGFASASLEKRARCTSDAYYVNLIQSPAAASSFCSGYFIPTVTVTVKTTETTSPVTTVKTKTDVSVLTSYDVSTVIQNSRTTAVVTSTVTTTALVKRDIATLPAFIQAYISSQASSACGCFLTPGTSTVVSAKTVTQYIRTTATVQDSSVKIVKTKTTTTSPLGGVSTVLTTKTVTSHTGSSNSFEQDSFSYMSTTSTTSTSSSSSHNNSTITSSTSTTSSTTTTSSTSSSSPTHTACGNPSNLQTYSNLKLLIPQPGSSDTTLKMYGGSVSTANTYAQCCEVCYSDKGMSCLGFSWDPTANLCLLYRASSSTLAPNPIAVGDSTCNYGQIDAVLISGGLTSNVRPGPCIIATNAPSYTAPSPTPSPSYLGTHPICGNAKLSPGYESISWQSPQPNDASAGTKAIYSFQSSTSTSFSTCCEVCYNAAGYQSCLAFSFDPAYQTCTIYAGNAGNGLVNPSPYPGTFCQYRSFQAGLAGQGNIHPGPCLIDTLPTSSLAAPTSTPTSIIANGDFELGTYSWSLRSNTPTYSPSLTYGTSPNVHGGSSSGHLSAASVPRSQTVSMVLFQSVNTVSNYPYDCQIWYNIQTSYNSGCELQPWLNNQQYGDFIISAGPAYVTTWRAANFTLTGSGALDNLEFRFTCSSTTAQGYDLYVDDVKCTAALYNK